MPTVKQPKTLSRTEIQDEQALRTRALELAISSPLFVLGANPIDKLAIVYYNFLKYGPNAVGQEAPVTNG